MTRILRQSTQVDVRIGPFVDVGDGFTPETGVTLSGADEAEALRAGTATLDISGATWAAVTGADGWYTLTLSTTATSTVGELVIVVQDDNVCLPVYQTFYVVEEAVFDAFFAASAGMAVTLATGAVTAAVIATGAIDADAIADNAIDAGAIASGAITSAKFAAGAIDAAAIANGAIDAATFAADVDAEILSYIVDDATRIDASALNTATGTTIPAILDDTDLIDDGTSGLAKIATDVAAILVDTAEIGAAGAGLTALATAAALATLDSNVDDILTDTGTTLPGLIGTPTDLGGGATLAANNVDMAGATFAASTDSQEAIRNRGDAAWTTATGFSTHSASDVWAAGTRTLTALDEDDTTIDLDATIAAAVPAASAIADAVWDEDATGHQTGGTFGQAIGDPGANTETIYDAVVTDAAGTNVAADIIAVKAETASILTDTAEIGAAGAGLTEAGGTGDHLTAINLPNQTMDITGNITGNLSGSVGSVTALASDSITAAALAADAGAEIADAILNRDMSTGTDSGSTTVRTPRQALRFLRNKWSISDTTLTVTKEDDSTASWTTELTTSGSADPVVGSDPAGP